jgi:hypothetical protein
MTNFAANFAYIMNIGDYNSLFIDINSSYSSNSSLTINQVYLSSLLEMDNVSPMYLQNEDIEPLGFETCGKKSLGYRLIEVAAFSLFKSATARAALANKTQYYNGTNQDFSNTIAESLNTSFATDSNSIYNQYGYNFSGINFAVNYYHTGFTMGINRGHSYYGPIAGSVNNFNHTLLLILTEDF